MNYFNGITNEKFIKDFIDELYSKMEFVHEVDEENERQKEIDGDLDIDYDTVYVKYINEVETKLCKKLLEILDTKNLDSYEVERIYNEKRIELFALLSPMIDEWILKIKVDYGFN